jgi:hypothetical protein
MFRSLLVPALLAAVAAASAPTLDEGRLDPAWFGGSALEFREIESADYLWVKPGFSAEGRTFWVKPWESPAWLGKDRDVNDAARAEELTKTAHSRLKGALANALRGRADVSLYKGDVIVHGRLVDVKSTRAARFSGAATWDVRFTDAKTGELLMAVHHRAINANFMSDLPTRMWKWMEAFAADLRYDFPAYGKAKPVKA